MSLTQPVLSLAPHTSAFRAVMPGSFDLPSLRRFDPATGDVTLVSDAEATDDELAQLEREHNVFLADVRAAYNARMAQLRIARNQRERGEEA